MATSLMVFAIVGFVWLGTAWCHRTFAEVCRIRIDELEATQQEDVQRLRRLIRDNKINISSDDEIGAVSGGFQRTRRAAWWIVSIAVYTLSLCAVAIMLLSIWDVSWVDRLMGELLTSDSPVQTTLVVVVVLLGSVLLGTQWLQSLFAHTSEFQIAVSDRMWWDESRQLGRLLLDHGINPYTGDGVGPDDVILWD